MAKRQTIKEWAIDDRPREKLLEKGVAALSDAELLAILIGTGTKGYTAVDLGKLVLTSAHNNLDELGRKSIVELQKHIGLGKVKAIILTAALELGRRRQAASPLEYAKIISSHDAFKELWFLRDAMQEEFWLLLLNNQKEVIKKVKLSMGGINYTTADIRLTFFHAIEQKATSIIIAHNHPSGALTPSEQDRRLTQKMADAGKILDIAILDHIIVSKEGYYSFADQGML